jgi:hypothetical protein
MSESFSITYGGEQYVGKTPDTCPLCHVRVHIDAGRAYTVVNGSLQKLFECPSCHNFFLGYYVLLSGVEKRTLHDLGKLDLKALSPSTPRIDELSKSIKEISPSFASIYTESHTAKEMGLEQIAGPGFRKAFEFLIKDYAQTRLKDDKTKEEVAKVFVGTVVSKFIEDPRIQDIAKRALWLGNDETHYLRKWTEHDIEDLIALIRLTIHWIEMELLSERYKQEMPDQP